MCSVATILRLFGCTNLIRYGVGRDVLCTLDIVLFIERRHKRSNETEWRM